MAVRFRVRIERVGRGRASVIETVALANSGFEADEPEVLLPAPAAERLGFWPSPPGRVIFDRFASPAGAFRMPTVPAAVRVSLGRQRRATLCCAVISEQETEVILSDRLVEALRVHLVAPGTGLYRVGPRGRLRRSDEPERW